jgi:hypothetical protein
MMRLLAGLLLGAFLAAIPASATMPLYGGSVQSTFDTTRNGTGAVTFSNTPTAPLTATLTGSGPFDVSTFTTLFHSSGKRNFRLTPGASGSYYVGLASSTMVSASNTTVGFTADSIGIHDSDGSVAINGVVVGNVNPYAAGQTVDIIVDFGAKTIQNSVAGGAQSSAVSIASISTFSLSPAGTLHVNGNGLTFSGSPPVSFAGSTGWDQ